MKTWGEEVDAGSFSRSRLSPCEVSGVVEVEPAQDDVESVEPVKRALSTCTCTGRMGLSERSNKRRARTCADDGDARTNLAG